MIQDQNEAIERIQLGARRRARLLMTNWCFSNKDFSHGNTYSARAHKLGNGGQQMDGKYEQVNHAIRTVAPCRYLTRPPRTDPFL